MTADSPTIAEPTRTGALVDVSTMTLPFEAVELIIARGVDKLPAKTEALVEVSTMTFPFKAVELIRASGVGKEPTNTSPLEAVTPVRDGEGNEVWKTTPPLEKVELIRVGKGVEAPMMTSPPVAVIVTRTGEAENPIAPLVSGKPRGEKLELPMESLTLPSRGRLDGSPLIEVDIWPVPLACSETEALWGKVSLADPRTGAKLTFAYGVPAEATELTVPFADGPFEAEAAESREPRVVLLTPLITVIGKLVPVEAKTRADVEKSAVVAAADEPLTPVALLMPKLGLVGRPKPVKSEVAFSVAVPEMPAKV